MIPSVGPVGILQGIWALKRAMDAFCRCLFIASLSLGIVEGYGVSGVLKGRPLILLFLLFLSFLIFSSGFWKEFEDIWWIAP